MIDGLADVFAIRTDDEFDQFIEIINEQVMQEDGHTLFSYLIPSDYHLETVCLYSTHLIRMLNS